MPATSTPDILETLPEAPAVYQAWGEAVGQGVPGGEAWDIPVRYLDDVIAGIGSVREKGPKG